jgi:tetratricopeptide (TPR) repeat protein/predicted Ser/Thr protein kinase
VTCLDDATVLGLVEGRLAPELIARVDEHIDTCASCREVVTLVAGSRAPGRVLARGDNIGRYVIGDLLGAGAMGRVYSAWEPELDRRVAIKVLHDEGSRDRLVREAQAMARLNHPNVVTVHEVGSTEAGVFVAMELVDGDTLRAWAQQPRTWRDVARVLVEVARGLAAVHAAGVVHRDIKPDNVIVGADGRVRLGDFGLARSGGGSGAAPPTASFALGTLSHASGGTAVAGTPAYMAPELLRGGAADAASDQFSFGVMAYELLAGKRPFEGSTWADLLRAVENHDVRALPDVPSWLDDLVQRCIAVEPTARHASMRVVADQLTERLARRSPTLWLAGALAATLLASGITWAIVRDTREPRGQLASAWDASARATLVQRGVSPSTLAAIDRWNAAWIAERDEASRLARHDNVDRVAARERCLVQRRDELAALVDIGGANRLLDAVAALPLPRECRSADADPLPADQSRATAAREVLARLPMLRSRVALGEAPPPANGDPGMTAAHRPLHVEAARLVDKARDCGHEPTLAEALLVYTEALRAAGMPADAVRPARDAVVAAERGHADLLRARAWLARVAIAGELRDLDAAEDLGAVAHAAIDRIGAPHLAAQLARLRGLIAYNRGRLDEARTFLLAARSQFIGLGGERTLDIAAVDSALGSVTRATGNLDEAQERHSSVLALDRELRGANHRDIARDLHNIAGVLRLRGDLEAALATYREALAVEVATQGERSIAAALTHNSIGLVELERAHRTKARNTERPELASKADVQRFFLELDAARREIELARDIFTATNHGDRAFAEHNLGLVAQARGEHETALAHFDAAAKLYAITIGADAPAAVRLVEDRAASEQTRKSAKPQPRRAVAVPDQPAVAKPAQSAVGVEPAPPKKDVGVYGSAQSW